MMFFKKKKETPIFIYKSMILTLKLLSRSSDSTKMPFLPASRPPVTRGQIVIPHARLHADPQQQHMQIYCRINSVKSPFATV